MIGLLLFVLAILVSPFKEPACGGECRSPTSADRSAAEGEGPGPAHEQRSLVLYPNVSMVSVDPEGPQDHPPRDTRALASGRLSLLLALEVAFIRRAATA